MVAITQEINVYVNRVDKKLLNGFVQMNMV